MIGLESRFMEGVLQETAYQRVESIVSPVGDRVVRKTYKKPSRSFAIECAFLEAAPHATLNRLTLPVLVDKDANSFTMTFVERERQTRDSICLLYTSPSPRDATLSRMPSSA